MNFTKSPYEAMMKKPSHIQTPPPSKAPKGSRCHGCPYWQGHRLYVLLPGFAQTLGWREVMLWPVS